MLCLVRPDGEIFGGGGHLGGIYGVPLRQRQTQVLAVDLVEDVAVAVWRQGNVRWGPRPGLKILILIYRLRQKWNACSCAYNFY